MDPLTTQLRDNSLNKLNFVILDSIDVEYVPSIKDIKGKRSRNYVLDKRGKIISGIKRLKIDKIL